MAMNASRVNNTSRTPGRLRRGKLTLSKKQNDSEDRAASPMQEYINEVAGESPAIPSVNQRLGYLRPSRELLEYYRKKIAEYDTEHEQVSLKLDQYKETCEDQNKIQWEMRQREEEVTELQKALSDMQVYLFQEREHVLRLYAENDRLKIRELEDRKRIQQLLTLTGGSENEVSYFFKDPPSKVVIPQQLPKKLNTETAAKATRLRGKQPVIVGEKRKIQSAEERENEKRDNQTLALQVEALQAQLEEQSKLAREQSEAMMEDRRVKMEEAEASRQRDNDKISVLIEKLHKTQDLLYMSTQDYLSMKYDWRADERAWMVEKDKMLRELDLCKKHLDISIEDALNVSEGGIETSAKLKEECECLRNELDQAQKLSDMYREQVIELEGDLSRIKEEEDVSRVVFKDRTSKMTKRLELMNTRYQELEKRRNLEVEGFKNDIKTLRRRLKDMERQLYKVTVGYAEKDEEILTRPDDIDLAILKNVNRTSRKARGMQGDLKHLKSKIYSLESEMKHL